MEKPSLLDDSEFEDFQNIIKEFGYKIDDFSISHDFEMNGTGIQSPKEAVKVKRKSYDIEKTYNAGWGTSWPADFRTDITNGFFGKP